MVAAENRYSGLVMLEECERQFRKIKIHTVPCSTFVSMSYSYRCVVLLVGSPVRIEHPLCDMAALNPEDLVELEIPCGKHNAEHCGIHKEKAIRSGWSGSLQVCGVACGLRVREKTLRSVAERENVPWHARARIECFSLFPLWLHYKY